MKDSTRTDSLFHAGEVKRTLELLAEPGAVFEVRIPKGTVGGDRRTVAYAGYFTTAAKAVEELAKVKSAEGVYVTMNRIPPALLARASNRLKVGAKATGDADVERLRWLLVDLDPKRPAGISSTDLEHDAARARAEAVRDCLSADGWPWPALCDSGNGWHLLYRIDLGPEKAELVKSALAALATTFGDDAVDVDRTVFNPARITKLYGTLTAKGDALPDRPHRISRLVEVPDVVEVVGVAMLEALVAATRSSTATAPQTRPAAGVVRMLGESVSVAFAARHGLVLRASKPGAGGSTVHPLEVCPFDSSHTDGDAALVDSSAGTVGFRCFHNGCSGKAGRDVLSMFGEGGRVVERVTGGAGGAALEPVARVVVPPYRPFPVEVLPAVVRDFVEEAAADIGVDVGAVGGPVLVVLATAVGTARRLRVRGGWWETPVLWLGLIAKSGEKKSPGLQAAMAPLEEMQRKAFTEWREKMLEHRMELCRFKMKEKKWKGDGEPPVQPEAPAMRHYHTGDATPEKMADILTSNPRGVLAAVDELSGWFQRFDRYGNGGGGEAAQWLQMYNAGTLKVDRVGGGTRMAFPAGVWVVGTVQPERLKAVLVKEHKDSGLAARFLWVYPPAAKREWIDRVSNPKPGKAYAELVKRLGGIKPERAGLEGWKSGEMSLDRAARAEFAEWYGENGGRFDDAEGDEAAALSKMEAIPARLAIVLHLCRWVWGEPVNPDVVDAETMRAAVKLAQWFRHEAERVYAMLSEGMGDARVRDLVEWIRREGGSMTAAKLHERKRRTYAGTMAEGETWLRRLAAANLGTLEAPPPGPKGGRPKAVRFTLHPGAGEVGGELTPVSDAWEGVSRTEGGHVEIEVGAEHGGEV